MSLNPSTQGNSAIDVIDGTVSEFYNLMDQCIRRSEVMPGQYKSITSPSYSNNCPITESSFTTIDIGCPSPQVVDINNSFITANVEVPITFNSAFTNLTNSSTFFVGWRSSLDFLQRYIIYCNHKVVYDQVYVGEESFILQSLIPEHVRCRRPNQYTTYDNASNFSPDVCGTYITIQSQSEAASTGGSFTVNVKIPIKLDINQFLLFQNFKYLPGFCGTWSIKLYPAVQNMIVCPVNPRARLTAAEALALDNKKKPLDDYTHHFVQIGDKVKALTTCKITSDSETATFTEFTITAGKLTVENVLYHQTQFELMYDVYDALKARYMARPLTIPVNKLDYGRFAGIMKNDTTSSTYTAAVSNVESIFILPFHDDNHHTICQNPEFQNFYLSISGFGNFPQQPFNTFGNDDNHIRFLNMTLDALNINNSPIAAPNKDLLNSLEKKKTEFYKYYYSGSSYKQEKGDPITQKLDESNFLIGIPFSNDIDFQGGLTSNGNINIKLSATNSIINTIGQALNGNDCSIGATVLFCCDCALMIKVIPYADQPEVRLITERIV
jgi:hypothetical protein